MKRFGGGGCFGGRGGGTAIATRRAHHATHKAMDLCRARESTVAGQSSSLLLLRLRLLLLLLRLRARRLPRRLKEELPRAFSFSLTWPLLQPVRTWNSDAIQSRRRSHSASASASASGSVSEPIPSSAKSKVGRGRPSTSASGSDKAFVREQNRIINAAAAAAATSGL